MFKFKLLTIGHNYEQFPKPRRRTSIWPRSCKNSFKNIKHWGDLSKEGGPMQVMFKSILEKMMKTELESHLGYSEGDVRNKKISNSRNGYYQKSIITDSANHILLMSLEIERDHLKQPIAPKFENKQPQLEAQNYTLICKRIDQ